MPSQTFGPKEHNMTTSHTFKLLLIIFKSNPLGSTDVQYIVRARRGISSNYYAD